MTDLTSLIQAFQKAERDFGRQLSAHEMAVVSVTYHAASTPVVEYGRLYIADDEGLIPYTVTPQEAAKVLLAMGGLPANGPVEAFHREIDWCRDNQNTSEPFHTSQLDGGTSCAEDIQDAWEAALRAIVEPPVADTKD